MSKGVHYDGKYSGRYSHYKQKYMQRLIRNIPTWLSGRCWLGRNKLLCSLVDGNGDVWFRHKSGILCSLQPTAWTTTIIWFRGLTIKISWACLLFLECIFYYHCQRCSKLSLQGVSYSPIKKTKQNNEAYWA